MVQGPHHERDHTRSARWKRLALSLFIGWHSLSGVGSVFKQTAMGEAIRTITRPYEQLLGLHQGWPMFAPNAPSAREWVEVEVRLADGQVQPQPPLVGERVGFGFSWFYLRAGKYDRNLPDDNNRFLRRAYAHWQCRQVAATGAEPDKVALYQAARRTPAPALRLERPDLRNEATRSPLDVFTCP